MMARSGIKMRAKPNVASLVSKEQGGAKEKREMYMSFKTQQIEGRSKMESSKAKSSLQYTPRTRKEPDVVTLDIKGLDQGQYK